MSNRPQPVMSLEEKPSGSIASVLGALIFTARCCRCQLTTSLLACEIGNKVRASSVVHFTTQGHIGISTENKVSDSCVSCFLHAAAATRNRYKTTYHFLQQFMNPAHVEDPQDINRCERFVPAQHIKKNNSGVNVIDLKPPNTLPLSQTALHFLKHTDTPFWELLTPEKHRSERIHKVLSFFS